MLAQVGRLWQFVFLVLVGALVVVVVGLVVGLTRLAYRLSARARQMGQVLGRRRRLSSRDDVLTLVRVGRLSRFVIVLVGALVVVVGLVVLVLVPVLVVVVPARMRVGRMRVGLCTRLVRLFGHGKGSQRSRTLFVDGAPVRSMEAVGFPLLLNKRGQNVHAFLRHAIAIVVAEVVVVEQM